MFYFVCQFKIIIIIIFFSISDIKVLIHLVICPWKQVTTSNQRFQGLHLQSPYRDNTVLNILAVPNKAVFLDNLQLDVNSNLIQMLIVNRSKQPPMLLSQPVLQSLFSFPIFFLPLLAIVDTSQFSPILFL